jgi:hypothetical protein
LRATYSKHGGVRYLFGAYDVHADRPYGRMGPHKSSHEVVAFYRQIRMRYRPKIRICLIADNLSAHKTPDIRTWAQENIVELVFTPTYAVLTGSSATSGRSASSSSTTPTTPTGTRSRKRWPTPSTTATAPTAISDCSRPNADS